MIFRLIRRYVRTGNNVYVYGGIGIICARWLWRAWRGHPRRLAELTVKPGDAVVVRVIEPGSAPDSLSA